MNTPSSRGVPGSVLAVMSGCGGAGGSSFAAVTAAVAARSGPSVLVDLDDRGGGIDVLLGAEELPGPRWSDVRISGGGLSPGVLTGTLPRWSDVAFLAVDPAGEVTVDGAREIVRCARTEAMVVLDVPRWPCGARDEALTHADLVVLVVPAEVRAVAAAARQAADLSPDSTVVAVRGAHRRLPAGAVADAVGLALLGDLPFDPAVADPDGISVARLRRGTAALARAALDLATGIGPSPAGHALVGAALSSRGDVA